MNKITPYTGLIIQVIPEYFKGIPVKSIKPVFSSKPQKSFFIL